MAAVAAAAITCYIYITAYLMQGRSVQLLLLSLIIGSVEETFNDIPPGPGNEEQGRLS